MSGQDDAEEAALQQSADAATIRDGYMLRLGYCPLRFRDLDDEEAAANCSLPLEDPRLSPHPNGQGIRGKRFIFYGHGKGSPASQPLLDRGEKNPNALQRAGQWYKERMRPGSTVTSIFNLCSATLGAGALALPYAFSKSGIFLGLFLVFLGILVTIFSIQLLIDCRTVTRLSSYEDLATYCFSSGFAVFVEVNIMLFCFGTCIAYIVAVADIILPITTKFIPDSFLADRKPLLACVVLLFMLPLSLFERISSIRFASLFGVVSILYLVMSISAVAITHIVEDNLLDSVSFTSPIFFNVGLDAFLSISIIMFAFTSQVNVFSIYTELQRPSIRRMKRVVMRSTLISAFFYTTIGVFAFLENQGKTESDILKNYDISSVPIAIAQMSTAITVMIAFPLNVFPCRFSLEMMLFKNEKPSKAKFVALTVVLVGAAMVMAMFIEGIDVVFTLLGSICSSIVCFILPGLYYIRIHQMHDKLVWDSKTVAAAGLVVSGALLGVIGTAVSLLNIVQ